MKEYQKPEVEIIDLKIEEVITASAGFEEDWG